MCQVPVNSFSLQTRPAYGLVVPVLPFVERSYLTPRLRSPRGSLHRSCRCNPRRRKLSDISPSPSAQFHQPARPSCTAPRRIRERVAERARLRALRVISLQLTVAIFRLLLGCARANALRKNRPESKPAHSGDCNNSLEGRLVLGRDALVPFEPAASATLISTASACLRTSIFGRL